MRAFIAFHVLATLTVAIAATTGAQTPAYDLVIRNGKIVDGTGSPWFHGDLAVKGAKIAAIGKIGPASGTREIDAKGMVVAPGFVDIHSHSEFTLLQDG